MRASAVTFTGLANESKVGTLHIVPLAKRSGMQRLYDRRNERFTRR